MIKKLFLFTALAGLSASAWAEVVLSIDGSQYPSPQRMEYFIDSKVFRIDFDGAFACVGPRVVEPTGGLTLNIENDLYEVTGPITLSFLEVGVVLTIETASGSVSCQADRIFGTQFAMLGK
jgi:hypothetical protein